MESYRIWVKSGNKFYVDESGINKLYAECVRDYYTSRGIEAYIENERTTIPDWFDYDKLVTLTESDMLRNGCDPDKVNFLFCMGAETIEYDRDTDNVWYAGDPTGLTLAEFVSETNSYEFADM